MRTFIVAGILLSAGVVYADKAKDEAALKAMAQQFVEGWNKHDAKAMAAIYTDDGELVDPFGAGKGRDGVEKEFAGLMAGPGKASTTTLEIREWEPLKGDYALLNLDQTTSGMMAPDGKTMPPQKFTAGCVAVKAKGKWAIRYCHVGLVPPMPPAPPAKH